MSGRLLLLDSTIVIDHFNGVSAATALMRAERSRLRLSAITRAEVLTGFDEARAPVAAQLLDQIPLYPIEKEDAELAARLRRTHRWRLPDAVALRHGCLLVTRDTRDFDAERDAFIMVPYSV